MLNQGLDIHQAESHQHRMLKCLCPAATHPATEAGLPLELGVLQILEQVIVVI